MNISKHNFSLIGIYIGLVLIWATTPLAIVWSVQEIHPMWVLIFRYNIAFVLAFILLLCLKERLSFDRISLMSYLAGSLNLIGAQLFIYLAANYLTSGLMALLFGFSPLVAGLMGYLVFKSQKLLALQWVGMGIAVSGLVFIFSDQTQQHIQPIGIILIFISIISYICSIFWVKKIAAPLSTFSQATGSLLISAIGSWCIMPFVWSSIPTTIPSTKALWGFGFTVVFSSIVAMLCYFWLIRVLKPSTVSMSNIITPIIALILGATLNQEHLAIQAVIGISIAISGIALYFFAERKTSAH